MSTIGQAASLYVPQVQKTKTEETKKKEENKGSGSQSAKTPKQDSLIFGALDALANMNGFESVGQVTGKNQTASNEAVDGLAGKLESGNKEEVREEAKKNPGKVIPALISIVQNKNLAQSVRTDAMATLAKIADDGVQPAAQMATDALFDLTMDQDASVAQEAIRALANAGMEIMDKVEQWAKSGDPKKQEIAEKIMTNMEDAWQGYESDPEYGRIKEKIAEIKGNKDTDKTRQSGNMQQANTIYQPEQLPLYNNNKQTSGNNNSTTNPIANNFKVPAPNPDKPENNSGYTRQHGGFSLFG